MSAAAAPPRPVSVTQPPKSAPSKQQKPAEGESQEFTLVRKRGRRGCGRGVGDAGAGVDAKGDRGLATTGPPAQKPSAPVRTPPRRPPLPAVILRSVNGGSDTGVADSEKTKRLIMETLNPVREGIRVCGVKKMKNGAVLVETNKQADIDKILKNPALSGEGLEASLPALFHPEVIVYNIYGGSS